MKNKIKKNNIYFGLIILFLLTVIVWAVYGMVNTGKQQPSKKVSVILDNSSLESWISLKLGMEQAAADYNINLNVVSTGTIVSTEEEILLIDREKENGAQGIAVWMVESDGAGEYFENMGNDIPLVLIENDVDPEGVYPLIASDNETLGRELAKAIINDYTNQTGEPLKIGIIADNLKQLSMEQRLNGFLEVIKAENIQIQYDKEDADILVALGNQETEETVDYIVNNFDNEEAPVLYGEGNSEKNVYYLDKGIIKALIVPDEFNMGYQSIEALAERLEVLNGTIKSKTIDYILVYQEDIYTNENEKMLFPIVQ